MQSQIALFSTSAGPSIAAWDLATGSFLTAYKGGGCGPNGLSLLGRDYLIAAQVASPALHFWTWHKDVLLQRCFAAEPLRCVAASDDGGMVAGGGASGRIYIWQSASGRLLRSWPAHYKPVTALMFADSGRLLLSGGGDALVHAWLLMDVLDSEAATATSTVAALHSWPAHTLTVTALWVGAGALGAFVATASLDHSCHVYSLATGEELAAFRLPAPLRSLAADPWEHAMYVGGADGRIFEVSLLRGGLSAVSGRGSSSSDGTAFEVLEGHSAAVTALGFTADGTQLVSGSEDGSARVWDAQTRQAVRVLANPAKGPISSALVLPRPAHLAAGPRAGGAGGGEATRGLQRPAPLASFARYPTESKPWNGVPSLVDGSLPYRGIAAAAGLLGPALSDERRGVPGDGLLPLSTEAPVSTGDAAVAGASGSAGQQQDEIQRLRSELAAERETSRKWAALHAQLLPMCERALAQPLAVPAVLSSSVLP